MSSQAPGQVQGKYLRANIVESHLPQPRMQCRASLWSSFSISSARANHSVRDTDAISSWNLASWVYHCSLLVGVPRYYWHRWAFLLPQGRIHPLFPIYLSIWRPWWDFNSKAVTPWACSHRRTASWEVRSILHEWYIVCWSWSWREAFLKLVRSG